MQHTEFQTAKKKQRPVILTRWADHCKWSVQTWLSDLNAYT